MARLAFASAALILSVLTQPVAAEPPSCTQRTDVVDHLASEYAEVPVAMGLVSNGSVIEVLSSRTGESWTIIVTMPTGTSCMVAAGENWETVPRLASLGPSA